MQSLPRDTYLPIMKKEKGQGQKNSVNLQTNQFPPKGSSDVIFFEGAGVRYADPLAVIKEVPRWRFLPSTGSRAKVTIPVESLLTPDDEDDVDDEERKSWSIRYPPNQTGIIQGFEN